jgi:altronate hydrolase
MVGSGANMVLFTTGLGTFLQSIAPVVKISSNSELAKKCQILLMILVELLLEKKSIDEMADEMLNLLLM